MQASYLTQLYFLETSSVLPLSRVGFRYCCFLHEGNTEEENNGYVVFT
jgi:hypothetical protein